MFLPFKNQLIASDKGTKKALFCRAFLINRRELFIDIKRIHKCGCEITISEIFILHQFHL